MRACTRWRRYLFLLPLILFLFHTLSGLQGNKKSTSEVLHGKNFDHLVLGPAAGEGLPNRLHCQGNKALNKTHNSASSTNSKSGDNISLVTVFTSYNSSIDGKSTGQSSDLVTVGNNKSYNKVERSLAILDVFINFIQMIMPESSLIILTDPASPLPVHRNKVTVYPIQGEYSRDRLMLQRIRSYIQGLSMLVRGMFPTSEAQVLHRRYI